MARYIFRQALSGLAALFLFVTLFFFAAQVITPHDYVTQFAQFLNTAELNALRAQMGLDLPLWQQYFNWLGLLVRGNLGYSFSGRPVAQVLGSVLPTTLLIFFTGGSIAFLIGISLGKLTAWRGPKAVNTGVTLGGIMFYTAFPPWLAFLCLYYLARQWNIFLDPIRVSGFGRFGEFQISRQEVEITLLRFMLASLLVMIVLGIVLRLLKARWRIPPVLYVLVPALCALGGAYAIGMGPAAVATFRIIGLPVFVFGLLSFGDVMVIMQTSMRDVISEPYVRVARAKGLKERQIRDRHAARNAILPVMSKIVTSLPYLLSGLVIVEYALEVNGVGSVLFGSMVSEDTPVVMGVLLVTGAFTVLAQLVIDVLQAYLDPRIRYSGVGG